MKTKRTKKKAKHADSLKGRVVLLKSLPKGIKRVKKIFKVGKKYTIQKAPKKYLNSEMSVFLKGSNDILYQIQFPHYILTAN